MKESQHAKQRVLIAWRRPQMTTLLRCSSLKYSIACGKRKPMQLGITAAGLNAQDQSI